MNEKINASLMGITRRAESVDPKILVETFVDVGPLFTALSIRGQQVVYGRRGTGKTHDLIYLAETLARKGDLPVYLDLRTIGSTGGIYADPNIPLAERATRLLADTLSALHSKLLSYVVNDSDSLNLAEIGPHLDRLAEAITQVQVVGTIEQEDSHSHKSQSESSAGTAIQASLKNIEGKLDDCHKSSETLDSQVRTRQSGVPRHRIHFGATQSALSAIVTSLAGKHIWLLIDEWSVTPLDIQPYLADLLRRSVFPVFGISVKIGAIEQRCTFRLVNPGGDYVGIELGADASADLNLDDFMVFDNDANAATEFFQELLFRHNSHESPPAEDRPKTSHELIQRAFTQRAVFEELVKASEGVPRDFIHILSLAAQKAFKSSIAVGHVRAAAKAWYQQDKQASVNANPPARELLHYIIDEVIGNRRTRAFLWRSDLRNQLIDALFDARVLHLLKRGISSKDEPGVRYDVYKIDYGCYVDLLTTTKAPLGLFQLEDDEQEGQYIDVPPDDYRAIRRAILTMPVKKNSQDSNMT